MEEDQADEDLDILREMEAEEEAGNTQSVITKAPKSHVMDSQVTEFNSMHELELPLGADGENGGGSGEDDEENRKEGLGRDGKPLKIWKKRGQKRTTRKVNIRPNTAKWKPEPEWKANRDTDDEANEAESTIRETQIPDSTIADSDNKPEADDASFLDEESDLDEVKGKKQQKKKETKTVTATAKSKAGGLGTKQMNTKPRNGAPRANANYRALKINRNNSTGKMGRFGGRRR